MMSFRKVAIATMLAVSPVLAVGAAWANTELVPGSRLVAPYWDISGDRSTLMLITNVSRRANLVRTADVGQISGNCNLLSPVAATGVAGTNCGVHLEFYDKTCTNVDLSIDLTRQDIDQLDLLTDTDLGGVRGLPSRLGWLDVDVRRAYTGSGHSNTSVQANVLVGTVIISDSGSDFAIAYPMASSQGSSGGTAPQGGGVGSDIVSRSGLGVANKWTGGYESFPARVYVPMFFAEGSNNGATFTSTLAIAGPAQAIDGGEAPGQTLEDDPSTANNEGILIRAPGNVDIMDACENAESDTLTGHYIFGTLDELFTQQVTAPYGSVCGSYPAGDVDRKTTGFFQGGYIDIPNIIKSNTCSDGNCTLNTNIERGLVGVLVQSTATRGDATRLWGDCSYGNGEGGSITVAQATQVNGSGIPNSGSTCRTAFSLVNTVAHNDLRP